MTEELTSALKALGTDVQALLATVQQLCASLEAARAGKRRAEAEVLRLAMVLSRVKAELDDDGRWITDLNSRKIAVEFSPSVRQAVTLALSEKTAVGEELSYLQALEHLATLAGIVADSPDEATPEIWDALRKAVGVWRELARRRPFEVGAK